MADKDIDEISGVATTGHSWDGIKELNNPLPRWWLWTFYACCIYAFGYMIAYPAIPLIRENTKGLLGYSSRSEVAAELAGAKKAQAGTLAKIAKMSLADIRKDDALFQFAVAGGASAFKVNCVQCHGSGAAGGKGYPNLNDDDWLWGGDLKTIHTTLQHGVRFEQDDDTRVSEMPAFGADESLDKKQISDVAEYVLKLSRQEYDDDAAKRGAEVFAENCTSCHGEKGEGNREAGGPRLTDGIWLYGNSKKAIMAQVNKPRQGVMPAWGHRLDAATIKQLALYVHSLGGGE